MRILAGVPMFLGADWKQGAVVTTSTRKIACTWTEWESSAAVRDRRREERDAQDAERERSGDPDPDRDVPVAYEDLPPYREPYVVGVDSGGEFGHGPV